MKLIALVTIEPGSVPPGDLIDIKDKAEAESLIARGLAALPPKAEPRAPASTLTPTPPAPAPVPTDAATDPEQ